MVHKALITKYNKSKKMYKNFFNKDADPLKKIVFKVCIFLYLIGVLVSLFSDEFEGMYLFFIFGGAFFWLLIVPALFLYFVENIDKIDWDRTAKINGICPKCLKKINRFSTKCPYCTSDL